MLSLHFYFLFLCLFLFLFSPNLSLSLPLQINTSRLLHTLQILSTHNDLTPPSVQRILYTPSDLSARAYLTSLFTSSNLTTRFDAVGNLFAVFPGSSSLPPIATGSHIDAIPHSGIYDGTYGVLGALEAIRALQALNFKPERDIHIIAFTSEEPTRFGIGCLGSRLLSSAINTSTVSQLFDTNSVSFEQARTEAGFTGSLNTVPLSDEAYDAFVELHIEQADLLETSGIEIGAVTAISAPAQLQLTFSGPGGHAGALAMSLRHDPLLAAADTMLEVERAALETGSEFSVATVGNVEVFPGAVNSVPRQVKLGIDVRDVDLEQRDEMAVRIMEHARENGKKHGVDVEEIIVNADAPAMCSDRIVRAVEKAAKDGGLSVKKMVSRAYHDALFMARKFDVGMIFVPCRGGVSHRPDEFVEERDLRNGVETLARTLATLAGSGELDIEREEL